MRAEQRVHELAAHPERIRLTQFIPLVLRALRDLHSELDQARASQANYRDQWLLLERQREASHLPYPQPVHGGGHRSHHSA